MATTSCSSRSQAGFGLIAFFMLAALCSFLCAYLPAWYVLSVVAIAAAVHAPTALYQDGRFHPLLVATQALSGFGAHVLLDAPAGEESDRRFGISVSTFFAVRYAAEAVWKLVAALEGRETPDDRYTAYLNRRQQGK